MVSGIEKIYFDADKDLLAILKKAAEEAGVQYNEGIIASGDRFVVDPADKKFIVDTFGASACEMEGAEIAQACFSAGVTFCVVRSIVISERMSSVIESSSESTVAPEL